MHPFESKSEPSCFSIIEAPTASEALTAPPSSKVETALPDAAAPLKTYFLTPPLQLKLGVERMHPH